MPNPYCDILHIATPRLEQVKNHPEVNAFSLLIVALLGRGAPMTLEDVAQRFDEAGVAPADVALQSLQRCRPARTPIYRDGDSYALDGHDDEADLWAFRLGLRPARMPALIREAHEENREIEIVVGSAPGWADPWSRVRRCCVEKLREFSYTMFDEVGVAVDEREVQLARLGRRAGG